MKVRCLKCNNAAEFQKTRGSKLQDLHCNCGGNLSQMTRAGSMGAAGITLKYYKDSSGTYLLNGHKFKLDNSGIF